jgi:hypothetical protein
MSDEMQERLEAVAESALLSGALEEASARMRAKLDADPEWATKKYVHAHTIVEAFAVGVIRADPWHRGYRLPPNFEAVVNWIAFNVQKHWPRIEVPEVSLNELEQLFREWALEHPDFRAWNETTKMVGVVSRYSAVPDERDFIDLDALIRNAVIHIRNEHRTNDDFERRIANKGSALAIQRSSPGENNG